MIEEDSELPDHVTHLVIELAGPLHTVSFFPKKKVIFVDSIYFYIHLIILYVFYSCNIFTRFKYSILQENPIIFILVLD